MIPLVVTTVVAGLFDKGSVVSGAGTSPNMSNDPGQIVFAVSAVTQWKLERSRELDWLGYLGATPACHSFSTIVSKAPPTKAPKAATAISESLELNAQ